MHLLASEVGPQWGGGWKTLYCHICLYLIVVRYIYIFMHLLASEAGPQWGGGWKTLYCHICRYLIVVRYIYIYALIGEWSGPSVGRWVENFVLSHMPVFDCCKVYIFMHLLASEAGPQWGGGWKTLYCHICLYLIVVRYIYIYALIGEWSRPSVGRWVENFVLPHMPVFDCCKVYIYLCTYWRVKRALSGEVGGKLCIVTYAGIWLL